MTCAPLDDKNLAQMCAIQSGLFQCGLFALATKLGTIIDRIETTRSPAALIFGVVTDISAERARQIRKGRTPEHDDLHVHGALRKQAAALACDGTDAHVEDPESSAEGEDYDPFGLVAKHGYRGTKPDERRALIIAAALLVAEIERLDRAKVRRLDRAKIRRANQASECASSPASTQQFADIPVGFDAPNEHIYYSDQGLESEEGDVVFSGLTSLISLLNAVRDYGLGAFADGGELRAARMCHEAIEWVRDGAYCDVTKSECLEAMLNAAEVFGLKAFTGGASLAADKLKFEAIRWANSALSISPSVCESDGLDCDQSAQ